MRGRDTHPTLTSVLRQTKSASCPEALFCMAWTMLSSVTASATWLSLLRCDRDEDEGRGTCPRGSARFLRGIAIMANLRGLDERLTTKTPHENGLPTSTLAGPENEMVTPTSVTEYARSRKELRWGCGAGGVAVP